MKLFAVLVLLCEAVFFPCPLLGEAVLLPRLLTILLIILLRLNDDVVPSHSSLDEAAVPSSPFGSLDLFSRNM